MFDNISSTTGGLDANKVLNIVNQYKSSIENSSQKSTVVYRNVTINGKELFFAKKTVGLVYPDIQVKYLGSYNSEPNEYEIAIASNHLMCTV